VPATFGLSTHLFHGSRLSTAHLKLAAQYGFSLLELYATRSHFDYRDPAHVDDIGQALADHGLTLHSVHAPTTTSFSDGVWGPTLSLADADESRRRQAVDETLAAMTVASRVPFRHLVVHLGAPDASPALNQRAAAQRSLDALAEAAEPLGIHLALEIIPNALSHPGALVTLIEDVLEHRTVGICLDTGHAHLWGDVTEAIEICSGHLHTTHLHDNHGRRDEHLIPGRGTIDWDGALLAFQKVGYDGAWMFELGPSTSPAETLAAAAEARRTLIRALEMEQ
jgi:sugar phosphate isomerase/epimerase